MYKAITPNRRNEMKIKIVEHRGFQAMWDIWSDGYFDSGVIGDPVGQGITEAEAVADLISRTDMESGIDSKSLIEKQKS